MVGWIHDKRDKRNRNRLNHMKDRRGSKRGIKINSVHVILVFYIILDRPLTSQFDPLIKSYRVNFKV